MNNLTLKTVGYILRCKTIVVLGRQVVLAMEV